MTGIANGLTLPNSLANGQTTDASQVMANYNTLLVALNRALLDAGGGSGMNAYGSVIHNLGAGAVSTDAVNLGQLATYLTQANAAATYATVSGSYAAFVLLAGGTMTGALSLHDGTVVADVPSGTYYIVGYRDLPQSGGAVKTANYTATSADAGKHILCYGPSLTVTIPSNSSVPYPIGTFLTFINANGLSIAINTDTLTLANSTTTGTRTLALNGIATAIKISATAWLISGAGLS